MLETIQVLHPLVAAYDILIINDGSTDHTGMIADRLSKTHESVRVIHHKKNEGYGAALHSGFMNAANEWVFFTDGDHQFIMKEIEMLLAETDRYDAIIGYRTQRRDPPHRILYAQIWNLIIQGLFDLKVKDLNCAFKLIRKNILKDITLNASGALINAELLLKLKRAGARMKEIGVSHTPRQFGKQTGGNPKVILRALSELITLYRSMN